jgi:hypothetical protein
MNRAWTNFTLDTTHANRQSREKNLCRTQFVAALLVRALMSCFSLLHVVVLSYFLFQLAQDSRVEVPLWLATTLASRSYVTLELPRVFQPAFREMLLADPTVVDLHSKCSYFYEFGIKIATLSETHNNAHAACALNSWNELGGNDR